MDKKEIRCPYCDSVFEFGFVGLKVDVGLLNFFSGFSIGTKGRLFWSKDKPGLFSSKSYFTDSQYYEANKCTGCGRIIINP